MSTLRLPHHRRVVKPIRRCGDVRGNYVALSIPRRFGRICVVKKVPEEVAAVRKAMQANADRSLSPTLAKRAVSLEERDDGGWWLVDSFERYSDLVLEYKAGQWCARSMYSGERAKKISFGEALANANLFFGDK